MPAENITTAAAPSSPAPPLRIAATFVSLSNVDTAGT
jgi:hypothetical protein